MTAERDRRVSRAMASSVSTMTVGIDAQTCLVCQTVEGRRTARYTGSGIIIQFFLWLGGPETRHRWGSDPRRCFFILDATPLEGSGQAVPNSGTCALSIISKKPAMGGLTSNFHGIFMYVAIATSC